MPFSELPIELWTPILLYASDSLEDLCLYSSISKSIRLHTWTHAAGLKAEVLHRFNTKSPKRFPTTPPVTTSAANNATQSTDTLETPQRPIPYHKQAFSYRFFRFKSLPDAVAIFRILLKKNYLSPSLCPNALHHVQMMYGSPEIVLEFLKAGFDINPGLAVVAASRGHLEILRAYVQIQRRHEEEEEEDHGELEQQQTQQVTHNQSEMSLNAMLPSITLTAAASAGNIHIISELLSYGARPDSLSVTVACGAGHVEIVKQFLEMGVTSEHVALREAVKGNHLEVVRVLVGCEAGNHNESDDALARNAVRLQGILRVDNREGGQALEDAVEREFEEIMRVLVEKGARLPRGSRLNGKLRKIIKVDGGPESGWFQAVLDYLGGWWY
jgi:hypothetical protein